MIDAKNSSAAVESSHGKKAAAGHVVTRAARLRFALIVEPSPAWLAADDDLNRAYGKLHATVPTTVAGMLALLELADADGLNADRVLDLLAEGLKRMVGRA